jgi:hypothetical protein
MQSHADDVRVAACWFHSKLKNVSTVREGCYFDATIESRSPTSLRMRCSTAKLPERGWQILRRSFATHAAMFGINPWTINAWLGHKNIHFAEQHRLEIPARRGRGNGVANAVREEGERR